MPARKPWWGDAIKSDFAKYYSTAEKAQNDDGVMMRPAARNTASFGVTGFGSFSVRSAQLWSWGRGIEFLGE